MKTTIYKIILPTILFLTAIVSSAQSIYVEGGLLFLRNNIEKPLLYGVHVYSQEEYMMVGYEHYLPEFYKTFVSFDYSYYFKGAEFKINNPNSSNAGAGIDIVEAHVFAFGLRKPYFLYRNRLSVSVGIYGVVVNVNRTWPDSDDYSEGDKYLGIIASRAYPGWRFQPEVRFALDIRFFKRLHFYSNWGLTLGFSKWQDIQYNYSYDGVPQPTAMNSVNGTGYFTNIGLKLDIVSQER